jgi:NADPH:quinone reductase-like Zn-dependent oxidoreductase
LALGVRASGYLVEPSASGLDAVADLVRRGRLKPHVAATMPLAEVARAHALVADRHTVGKLILLPPCATE